ncbi:helix-turn-helix domain-containing protein [Salinicoccus sp. Marseille-QA3877]
MIILIIDDDLESNKRIKDFLSQSKHSDFEVSEAENANEAIKLVKDINPSIIITELSLNDLNGLELGKKFLSELTSIAIIAISQLKMFDLVQQSINIGFSGFHLKPLVKHEFLETIDRIILSHTIRSDSETSLFLTENETSHFDPDISRPIKTAIEYINLNYYKNISLKNVSEKVYLSPSHFSKLFKEMTETSFIEFLTETRVEKSKYLLKSTSLPIEVIAHQIGFSSATYFATTFKKSQGKTPRDYRSLYVKLE